MRNQIVDLSALDSTPWPMEVEERQAKHKPITDQDEHYNALLNFTRQLDTEPWVHTITFARHVGTRAMWLTAMSLREPHLILEDDVVLLPSACNTCQDKKYHNLTLYNGVWRSYDELPSVDELRDAIAQSIKFGRR